MKTFEQFMTVFETSEKLPHDIQRLVDTNDKQRDKLMKSQQAISAKRNEIKKRAKEDIKELDKDESKIVEETQKLIAHFKEIMAKEGYTFNSLKGWVK